MEDEDELFNLSVHHSTKPENSSVMPNSCSVSTISSWVLTGRGVASTRMLVSYTSPEKTKLTFRHLCNRDNVVGGQIEDLRKLEAHLILGEGLLCAKMKDRGQWGAIRSSTSRARFSSEQPVLWRGDFWRVVVVSMC